MSKTLIQRAQRLTSEGKLTEALDIYQELLDKDPEQIDILHACAILQAKLTRYPEALASIKKAIDLAKDDASLYNSQGNIFLRQSQLDQAKSAYQKAIQLKPHYAIPYNNLGNCYYRQHDLSKAEEYYQKALAIDPNYTDAHYNLGILFTQSGKTEQAIAALKKTLTLKPQHARANGQLAKIYLEQGETKKAIDYYQKRLNLEPNHVESLHEYGIALSQEGRDEEAISAFERTLISKADHPECHHNLANAYLKMGDPHKALNYYFRQLEIAPQLESYYNIGVILMYQERLKEAITYLNQTLTLDPHYLPAHLNLGSIFLKKKDQKQALYHYQQAAKIKPDDEEIQYMLSVISQQNIPKQAPNAYLKHLFDQYATYYDKHLTQYLAYQAPQKLYQAVYEETQIDQPEWIILDLGCGTGLCGVAFKNMARRLIGIDLSKEMIAVARKKNIYDELEVTDIESALDQYHDNNLITAADVLTYIGDCSSIFSKLHQALAPSGLFAFTVEKGQIEPYQLQETGRYAHTKHYIETLIQEHHFKTLRFDNLILRKQQKQPVEGYLVLLQAQS